MAWRLVGGPWIPLALVCKPHVLLEPSAPEPPRPLVVFFGRSAGARAACLPHIAILGGGYSEAASLPCFVRRSRPDAASGLLPHGRTCMLHGETCYARTCLVRMHALMPAPPQLPLGSPANSTTRPTLLAVHESVSPRDHLGRAPAAHLCAIHLPSPLYLVLFASQHANLPHVFLHSRPLPRPHRKVCRSRSSCGHVARGRWPPPPGCTALSLPLRPRAGRAVRPFGFPSPQCRQSS